MNILSELTTTDNSSCNGIVYKAEISLFETKYGINYNIKLKINKKLSCPGCSLCNYDSGLSEIDVDHWPIIDIEKAENGKYYTIEIVNQHRDYESSIIDSWDLKLIEFIPEHV